MEQKVESWICKWNRGELGGKIKGDGVLGMSKEQRRVGKTLKRDVIYGMSMEQMRVRWKTEYRVCKYSSSIKGS